VTYCVNPWCNSRQNDDDAGTCAACGQPLLVNERFKVIHPILLVSRHRRCELLKAIDTTGSYISPPNSYVVLKTLVDDDPKIVELFRREATSLRYFNHPGIPKSDMDDLFTFQVSNGDVFDCYSMSYVDGENLENWIKSHGPITQNQAIDWLRQLAEILQEIHTKGFFHRDVKPSNIMLQPDGRLALIDFGAVREYGNTYFAKLARDGYGLTQVHTLGYSPPEQMNGMALPQSDFYALGQTLIYCVTGKSFIDRKVGENGKMLWQPEAKQINQSLIWLIENLIQPVPKDRPQNAQEIIEYLNNLPKHHKNKLFNQIRRNILTVVSISVGLACALGTVNFVRVYQAGQLYQAATAHADAGEWNQAKGALQQSLDINPSANGYAKLGEICYSMRDLDCARSQFEKAIAIAPKQYLPYLRLGRVFEDIADYQNAKNAYLKGSNVTNHPAIKNSLARLLIIRNEYDQAEKLLRNALADKMIMQFYRSGMYKNLAWIYFDWGKYGQAVKYASESIKLDNEFVVPYCLRALASLKSGLDSRADWDQCLFLPTTDLSENSEIIMWRQAYQKSTQKLGKK
jgi:tetratricopeptide (TPR) repeat protein